MRKRLAVLLLIFLTVSFTINAQVPRFIINSGHTGKISSLDYQKDKNLLFSGGHDGIIKVWNASTGKIKYQIQVSHMPIQQIEVSSSKPYVAAVVSDGINAANLSVWNWETGTLVYRHRLSENPLFVLFSPQGNFIMYGKTDWDSLVFLDADTGDSLNLIPEGFGIVSSAFISDSEKTLLTYNNSGTIQYWDLTNGNRKTKISTVANLGNISFTPSGRYMTGFTGKEILLIDLLNGTKIGSLPAENLVHSVIDQVNDKLVYAVKTTRDLSLNTVSITGSGFTFPDETTIRNFASPTVILSSGGRITTAYKSGSIYTKESYSENLKLFAENKLLTINDFAINETAFAATAPGKLISISSDFFTEDFTGNITPEITAKIVNTDKSSNYGISAGRGDDFLLWESQSTTGGSIRIFDSETGRAKPLSAISTPLISADYSGDKVLTLDLNGECRIIDYSTGEDDFKYSSYGLRTVDFIEGRNIIAGRNSSAALPSPLLHINTRTGETVPVKDSNLLIFDLEYDELTRKLYTLGFEERKGVMRTVLKQHTGRDHDRSETLFAVPGEDIDSTFTSDSESSKIFTSLGYGGVKMLYWGGFTSLENTSSIPKTLKLRGSLLATLNQDSSFTIFKPSNGAKIMDLFIFNDFSWAALLPENKFYVSEGAEAYVNVYQADSDTELSKLKYMIK